MNSFQKEKNIRSVFLKQKDELDLLNAIPPGIAYPRYIKKSHKHGYKTIDKIILSIKPFQKLSSILNDFFDDNNATLAVKKLLHKEFGLCLRRMLYLDNKAREQNISYQYTPNEILDCIIINNLEFPNLEKRDTFFNKCRLWVIALFRLKKELFKVLLHFIILGNKIVIKKISQKKYLFGIDNVWSCNNPGRTTRFNFIIDGKRVKKNDLVILMIRGKSLFNEVKTGEYNYIFFEDLKCPLDWYVKKIKSVFVFGIKILFCNLSLNSLDLLIKSYVLSTIRPAIKWELLMENYYIKNIFDIEEQTFSHVIKTIVLSKYGCRNILLPYVQRDTPAYTLSYLYYNYIFVSGKYYIDTYLSSWSKDSKIIDVGIWKNDDMLTEDSENAEKLLIDLVSQLYKHNRIITIFPTSSVLLELDLELVETGIKILENYNDCILFIKTKGDHNKYLKEDPIKSKLQPYINQRRVYILTKGNGFYSSAQYIFKYSTLNLANCGSVIVESLLANSPIFVTSDNYIFDTPFADMLKRHVLFDDPEALWEAIKKYLETGDKSIFRFEDYYELFDKYRDGKATERIRNELLH